MLVDFWDYIFQIWLTVYVFPILILPLYSPPPSYLLSSLCFTALFLPLLALSFSVSPFLSLSIYFFHSVSYLSPFLLSYVSLSLSSYPYVTCVSLFVFPTDSLSCFSAALSICPILYLFHLISPRLSFSPIYPVLFLPLCFSLRVSLLLAIVFCFSPQSLFVRLSFCARLCLSSIFSPSVSPLSLRHLSRLFISSFSLLLSLLLCLYLCLFPSVSPPMSLPTVSSFRLSSYVSPYCLYYLSMFRPSCSPPLFSLYV
jgi:hypothetical protein